MAPELEVVKTRILSDASLQMDFEACSVLFKDFLKQRRAAQCPPTCMIAQVNARKKCKADDTSSDVAIEDHYYYTKEYNQLTPVQKEKLRSICETRRHKPGSMSSKKKVSFSPGTDMTRNFEAVTHHIFALTSSVELLTTKDNRNEDHSDSDDDTQSTKSSGKGSSFPEEVTSNDCRHLHYCQCAHT